MALRFKNETNQKREWIESREPAVMLMIEELYRAKANNLETLKEKTRWDRLKIDDIAGDILYYYASMSDQMAIQNVIGAVASIINKSKDLEDVYSALETAGEIVLSSSLFLNIKKTPNDAYVVRSNIYDPEIEKEYYQKPQTKPHNGDYTTLGAYDFNIRAVESIDILRNTPFTVLPIESEEPVVRENATHAEIEEWKKWQIRQFIVEDFQGESIYFDWAPCYRGRIYSKGYHINPQGTELEKSMVTIDEMIELTPKGYVQICKSIASAFGHDKQTDSWKLNWYKENKDNLDNLKCKEPYVYKKLRYALRQYKRFGATNVTVELDGTNSQIQCVSVLTGDKKSASICNVIPTEDKTVADAYQTMADTMSIIEEQYQILDINNKK